MRPQGDILRDVMAERDAAQAIVARDEVEMDEMRTERDRLRAALDEAVELLDSWMRLPRGVPLAFIDEAHAFLARLGRDQ